MKTKLLLLTLLAGMLHSNAQRPSKPMIYFQPELTYTLKDRTKENNQSGLGLGIQAVFQRPGRFLPLANITADALLADDKVYRTNPNGTEKESIGFVLKIFAGVAFHPAKRYYVSLLAGPSFINGQTLLGLSPAAGVYLSKSKKWNAVVSWCNIFNRNSGEKMNYSSLNFSVGLRLF